MKRSIIETLLGAVVIGVAVFFLVFSYKTADVAAGAGGYQVFANFSGIGGLKAGDDVQISGVKIGKVAAVDLDHQTYLARVSLSVDPTVKLPMDTAALISSESLLGGKYLELQPGADEELLPEGGTIQFTQAPQNLEQLLGQFIFSMQDDGKEDEKDPSASAAAPAAPAPSPMAAMPPTEPPIETP